MPPLCSSDVLTHCLGSRSSWIAHWCEIQKKSHASVAFLKRSALEWWGYGMSRTVKAELMFAGVGMSPISGEKGMDAVT